MQFLRRLLLIGILVAIVSAALFGVGVSLRRAYVWRQFLLNQDRDLQSLDQPEAGVVLAEAARRWPEAFQEFRLAEGFHVTESGPALVGRLSIESERDQRFVFVALLHFQDERCPIGSHMRALSVLVDAQGRSLDYPFHSLGPCGDPRRVNLVEVAAASRPLVEIECVGNDHLGGPARSFYASVGERIALVRLEDAEGRLVPNVYAERRLRIEPQPPWREVADYDRVLRSGGWAETLEALVWLGGEHASSEAEDRDSLDKEAQGDRRLAEAARGDRPLRDSLERLARGDDVWTAEAARMALESFGKPSPR